MSSSFVTLVITLDATVQNLATVYGRDFRLLSLSMQPDGANANPVFVGDANVSSTLWGVRLEAAAATVPPAPWTPQENLLGKLKLSDVYVKGTNGEKLHVQFIPNV